MRRILLVLLLPVFALSGCTHLAPVEPLPESALPPMPAPLWLAIADQRPGEWYVLLSDPGEALDWRLEAIDSATRSIDLQTFLWQADAAGAAVIEHLVRAARRGVRVRILVDDSFLAGQDALVLYMQAHQNIDYRIYNPYARRANSVATRTMLNLADFQRLDHRMHNKSMVVDGQVAIVGGRNLADEYFGLHPDANFRDLELLVGGAVVDALSGAFDRYWNDRWSFPVERLTHVTAIAPDPDDIGARSARVDAIHIERSESIRREAWRKLLARAAGGTVRLLIDEPPAENPASQADAPVQVAAELVQIFDEADQEVVIVSAYLIPTPALEGAVERAIARGVRVRMLTNSISSNNHLSAHSAYRNHIDRLLGHGVELYEVRSDARDRHLHMTAPADRKQLGLHAKALIVDDDRVFVGSANLDPRSLRINTEMGLLVTSRTLNAQLRDALRPDFDAGNAWTLEREPDGRVLWISGDMTLTAQPAESFMQRIEDWFFAHLPIEGEL